MRNREVTGFVGGTKKSDPPVTHPQSSNRGLGSVGPSAVVPLPLRLISDVPTNYQYGRLETGVDTLLSDQFGGDSSKLQVAVNQYHEVSLNLELMLRKFFEDYHTDTKKKVWTPLPVLQTGQDIPLLDMAMKDVGNAIAILTIKFGVDQNSPQLKKAKRGLTEYMPWMITSLKTFLVIAKEGKAVWSIGGQD